MTAKQPLSSNERAALDRVIGPDARGAYRQAEDVWGAALAYARESQETDGEQLHELEAECAHERCRADRLQTQLAKEISLRSVTVTDDLEFGRRR